MELTRNAFDELVKECELELVQEKRHNLKNAIKEELLKFEESQNRVDHLRETLFEKTKEFTARGLLNRTRANIDQADKSNCVPSFMQGVNVIS